MIKKTTKNMNLKFNINIKATTSGEHQKSWVSNLLGSIKQLMMASNMLVSLMLSISYLPYKRISVS